MVRTFHQVLAKAHNSQIPPNSVANRINSASRTIVGGSRSIGGNSHRPSILDRPHPRNHSTLQAPDVPPFLDRPAIERLFGLRRRQSITLMHRLGGYQVGKTFLVIAKFFWPSSTTRFVGVLPIRRPADSTVWLNVSRRGAKNATCAASRFPLPAPCSASI